MQLLTLHYSLEHNKRAALAYLKHRLSQQEKDAAREYDELLQTYMDQVGLDLTRNMQPPKSVRIQVKVKEDFGELMTESGVMKLRRNNILFMRRDEVEPLIHQGVLEHV